MEISSEARAESLTNYAGDEQFEGDAPGHFVVPGDLVRLLQLLHNLVWSVASMDPYVGKIVSGRACV